MNTFQGHCMIKSPRLHLFRYRNTNQKRYRDDLSGGSGNKSPTNIQAAFFSESLLDDLLTKRSDTTSTANRSQSVLKFPTIPFASKPSVTGFLGAILSLFRKSPFSKAVTLAFRRKMTTTTTVELSNTTHTTAMEHVTFRHTPMRAPGTAKTQMTSSLIPVSTEVPTAMAATAFQHCYETTFAVFLA